MVPGSSPPSVIKSRRRSGGRYFSPSAIISSRLLRF